MKLSVGEEVEIKISCTYTPRCHCRMEPHALFRISHYLLPVEHGMPFTSQSASFKLLTRSTLLKMKGETLVQQFQDCATLRIRVC